MADIRVLIVEDDPFIAMDIESAVADELGDVLIAEVEEFGRDRLTHPPSESSRFLAGWALVKRLGQGKALLGRSLRCH